VWNLFGTEMMEIHLQEMLHPAATERLAREGSAPSGRRPYRQTCRWLFGLGQFLVVLGRRLQRVCLLPAVVMEEPVITERRIRA
jgi:hypothetical protein